MKKKSFFRYIIRYFLQGLIIIAPLSITIYVLYVSFVFIDNLLQQYIEQYTGISIPGLGFVVIIVGLTLIGFLGSTIIFKPIVHYFDRLVSKAPIVKIIYTSIKDFFTAFVGQKKRFTEPVLIKINKDTDLQKLGFVTNKDLSVLGIEGEKVAVYLPHSYNFSGNLFVVPAENVSPIKASSSDVMKFVISAGITDIESKDKKQNEETSDLNNQ